MSTLSSSSTFAQIQDSYANNASYNEDSSAVKAAAFVTACRLLLLKMPSQTSQNNSSLTMNPALIQKEMDKAQSWLDANGTSDTSPQKAAVRTFDLRGFRS